MAETGKHMEDVCEKDEIIRVYSVDRAGGILKDEFRLKDTNNPMEFENRVMAFAKRIENYINSGEDTPVIDDIPMEEVKG